MTTSTRLWAAVCTAGLYAITASPAFAQGRFADEDVERAKAFWIENATGGNGLDCLKTLNKALRILYEDDAMSLGSTVDRSMAALQRADRAGEVKHFGFYDPEGRSTFGVTEPKTLRESVWDWMLSHAQEPGYYLFGFSPLDGIHSVVLTLDTHDPDDPKVYWSDQWSSKGGWKLYATKADLEKEIEYRTNRWWKGELPTKFKSDAKLWPLTPKAPATPQVTTQATVIRANQLYVRTAPRKASDTHALDAEGRKRMIKRGETFAVLAREGRWVQLRLADGAEVWAHSWFLRLEEVPATEGAGGLSGAVAEQP